MIQQLWFYLVIKFLEKKLKPTLNNERKLFVSAFGARTRIFFLPFVVERVRSRSFAFQLLFGALSLPHEVDEVDDEART